MQASNAKTMRRRTFLPRPRRVHSQMRHNGRNARSAVLVSVIKPQSSPYPIHAGKRVDASKRSVNRNTRLRSRADRVVSHTLKAAHQMAKGMKAQLHPPHEATTGPKVLFPMWKMVLHVKAEKRLSRHRMVHTEASVKYHFPHREK